MNNEITGTDHNNCLSVECRIRNRNLGSTPKARRCILNVKQSTLYSCGGPSWQKICKQDHLCCIVGSDLPYDTLGKR